MRPSGGRSTLGAWGSQRKHSSCLTPSGKCEFNGILWSAEIPQIMCPPSFLVAASKGSSSKPFDFIPLESCSVLTYLFFTHALELCDKIYTVKYRIAGNIGGL